MVKKKSKKDFWVYIYLKNTLNLELVVVREFKVLFYCPRFKLF